MTRYWRGFRAGAFTALALSVVINFSLQVCEALGWVSWGWLERMVTG
jgi:hypothetical protein